MNRLSVAPSTVHAVLLGRAEFVAVIDDFSALVRRDEAWLNEMNVFPVADADTGTNLRRTLDLLGAAIADADDLASARLAVRTAALDGRGNSGLIIGQYLTGFVEPLTEPADPLLLSQCLAAAASAARLAVATPVDGTILSVADAVAAAGMGALAASDDSDAPPISLGELGDALVTAGREALARTTEQLAVLNEAGVVDSGGAGLVLFIEALQRVTAGESLPIEPEVHPPASEHGSAVGRTEFRLVGHEIQVRVGRNLTDGSTLRACLAELGTDVVVAEQGADVAGHVHVQDLVRAITAIEAALGAEPGQIRFDVEPLLERR